MRRLNNKIALITGAAHGIGQAAAYLFADEGASVVIADKDEAAGSRVRFDIEQKGNKALFFAIDAQEPTSVRQMIEDTVTQFGHLDILYNNAGVEYPKLIEDTSLEEWDETLDVNLRSVFLSCKFAIPHMIAQGGGVIINTGSVASLMGTPMRPAYDASKGGVLQLTRNIALDYGRQNIRANCICPGIIDTDMVERSISSAANPETFRRQCEESQPIGRLGRPEEVAYVALFLASSESSFVTGAALIVDGGLTACWHLPLIN